jgi:hypothetical protein
MKRIFMPTPPLPFPNVSSHGDVHIVTIGLGERGIYGSKHYWTEWTHIFISRPGAGCSKAR